MENRMSEHTIDAVSANESPSTPQASAESSPAVAVTTKAVRKPVKRSAEPKAAEVSAEAGTAAKPAKPSRAAAPVAKPPKAVKPAAAEPAKRVNAVKATRPAKPVKPVRPAALPEVAQPKPKLVRDSFTIPELEYAQLEALKRRALALAHHAKKSELLRAGIATLAAMDDARLLAALQSVPPLKTGRPKKAKAEKAAVKSRNGSKKS
jgi:hypothetical protein